MEKNQRQMRMGKKLIYLFSFGLWSVVCSLLLGLWSAPVLADTVCFQEHCFSIEIADTPEEQMRGLQFRTSLAQDAGMLFIFDQPLRYSFWMKDTLIPLDMIWLDQEMRVVHVESNVPPCTEDPCASYSPSEPALYVLELNAGTASLINLKPGDRLQRKSE